MKKSAPLIAVVIVLSGCVQAKLITANERSVAVEGGRESWAKTQPIADAECAKHGRKAAFTYSTKGFPSQYFYDCVL